MMSQLGSTTIATLPIELLSQILTLLPPPTLLNCGKVSTEWRLIMSDESIWRNAFDLYFGITARPGEVALGRRLEQTWRQEYLARVALITKWTKARTLANIVPIPKDRDQDFEGGPVDAIHVNLPQALLDAPLDPSRLLALAVSTRLGRAVIMAPFPRHTTHNLSKFYLNHLTAARSPLKHSSFIISNDGSRLIWGMADGSLRLVSTGLLLGEEGRGIAGSDNVKIRQRDRGVMGHRRDGGSTAGDAISAMSFSTGKEAQSIFVTAEGETTGFTGTGRRRVVIWRANSGRSDLPFADQLWECIIPTPILPAAATGPRYTTPASSTLLALATPSPSHPVRLGMSRRDRIVLEARADSRACAIALSAYILPGINGGVEREQQVLALGMNNGDVHVWTGIDLEESGVSVAEGLKYYYLQAKSAYDVNEDDRHIDPNSLFLAPVSTLCLDINSGSASLLVHRFNDRVFYKYTFTTSDSSVITESPSKPLTDYTETCFDHGEELGFITAIATDFSAPLEFDNPAPVDDLPPSEAIPAVQVADGPPPLPRSQSCLSIKEIEQEKQRAIGINSFGRTKYVVVGDDQGRIRVWNWETAGHENSNGKPSVTIQVCECKITAIEMGPGMLFVGGLDGIIRAYDPLTSFLIRIFKDRTTNPRHDFSLLTPADEAKCRVTQIRVNRQNLVAAIGGKLLSWSVISEVAAVDAKKKKKGRGLGMKGDRITADQELRELVSDSLSTLANESQSFSNSRRITLEYGLPSSLDQMTEAEAISLAMMLSAEEEEERENEASRDDAHMDELDLDLDGWTLEDDPVASSSTIAPARSIPGSSSDSLSPHYSYASPSYASTSWKPASQRTSPYFGASASPRSPHSHEKLQLSPRLLPTYGGASFDRSHPVPDLDNQELWPIASSSSSVGTPTRTSRAATPVTPASSGTPIRRGWNEVVQTPSPLPSSTLRTWQTTSGPSLLSAQLQSPAAASAQSRREEDELRFALELSMAEERSRMSYEEDE